MNILISKVTAKELSARFITLESTRLDKVNYIIISEKIPSSPKINKIETEGHFSKRRKKGFRRSVGLQYGEMNINARNNFRRTLIKWKSFSTVVDLKLSRSNRKIFGKRKNECQNEKENEILRLLRL